MDDIAVPGRVCDKTFSWVFMTIHDAWPNKIDQRKGFSFQDCILKCNDFQSLPGKCFRIVIKSLKLWSYNNIKLHGDNF